MNQPPSGQLKITEQSRVRRGRLRASYDRKLVYSIIDEALVAYLGIVVDGRPFVLPTSHWRDGDRIYWHGASNGRMTVGVDGQDVCLTLTLLDGLVLARSAFNHSVNYRSVMLFGKPERVTDPGEKARQLERFIEHIAPDRWDRLRPMNEKELKATGVMFMPIDEGSAKVRAAPPVDDEQDYDWPVWAGVLPLQSRWGQPEPCPRMTMDCCPPTPPGPWKAKV
ncbi:MAG: pyridoxamine 5'-phosphate oxidase family protein [Gammaproteobacteria bacterium]|nr:pyridoxamine 5'-phosphate oxidase family protein [Gammaproteobacteria bacterium]